MLKRLLVLAVALTLFVTVFMIYFRVADAGIEHNFRAEREQFHVEGLQLTTANPPVETAAPASAAVPVPEPNPTDAGGAVPLNSNLIVNPAAPATNVAPTSSGDNNTYAPPARLIVPGLGRVTLALVGSVLDYPRAQAVSNVPTAVPAPAAPVETNATVPASAPAPAPAPVAVKPASTAASSVIVLGYHQFSPPGMRSKNMYNMPQDVFEGEMKYLKDNGYHVFPLSDVVRFAQGQISLPPNSVAVTIDDGYKSSIVYAAPVLKKYGYPWTFFVYPSFITDHESKGAASWADLSQLQADGVDIECHSMTHPFLAKHRQAWKGPMHLLTAEEYDAFLTNETVTAKAELEQHLGRPVSYFAYPYGDHDKAVEAKVIAAGFKAIFTVAGNPIHPGTNLYAMGRYVITTPVEKAFTSYLREGALGLGDITPANGSTINDPRPVISAVLGYAGTINPATIVTEVRDMGQIRHDFDPQSSTLRLYLPRDLIDPVVIVDVRAKDAATGQTMVASWRFNYQPVAPAASHAPIGGNVPAATNPAPAPAAAPAPVTPQPPVVSPRAPVSNAAPTTP